MTLAVVYTRRKGRYPHSFRITKEGWVNSEGYWRPEVVALRNSMYAWARDNGMEFETAMNGLETNLRNATHAAMFKLRWMG